MSTESPVRDIMIEIITHESVGLPAIEAAGEVIAADAAANIRMADAQGHSTMNAMMDGMSKYKAEIETAEKAWSAFKEASARPNAFDPAPNEALEQTLKEIRRGLDQIGTK
jgi:hypothetical protein